METVITLLLPKTISLNTLYAGKHWTYRKKIKDQYKKLVAVELANYTPSTPNTYTIDIRYNSRLDVDNNVLVSKFVSDALVAFGFVIDDSPRYYKKLTIEFDGNVKRDYCEVEIRFMK